MIFVRMINLCSFDNTRLGRAGEPNEEGVDGAGLPVLFMAFLFPACTLLGGVSDPEDTREFSLPCGGDTPATFFVPEGMVFLGERSVFFSSDEVV